MRKIVLLLAVVTMSCAAFATNISLTPVQFNSFTQLSAGPGSGIVTSVAGPGEYSTNFCGGLNGSGVCNNANTTESANVGLTGLSISHGSGDQFFININNINENPWNFSLTVSDGTNTASTGPFSIVNGTSQYLFVNLSGLGTISSVYLTVSGTVPISGPINNNDFVAEYRVSAPEPSSMALLGSGFIGLAGLLRRKLSR